MKQIRTGSNDPNYNPTQNSDSNDMQTAPHNAMKRALVTGSSRGIGRAIALRLAEDGYHVLVHGSRPSDALQKTAEKIRQNGGSAETVIADLRDVHQAEKLAEEAKDLDVLILNASLQYRTPWREISVEACLEQLTCNYVSSLILMQNASDYMIRQNWGRIIVIGSVQIIKPHPDMLVYSASKSALENTARSLSLQLAKDGVTVNNVSPGVILTDRNRDALADAAYAKAVMESIPVRRYGQPEDCAGIVSFLCSDEAEYITGQTIYTDGGKGIQ